MSFQLRRPKNRMPGDEHERERARQRGSRRHGLELLGRERELAGHAHAHPRVAVEADLLGQLVHARERLLGRDQRAVVDDRLHDQHAARRLRQRLAEQDLAPRHRLGAPGALGVDRAREPVEHRRELDHGRVALAQRVGRLLQEREQPAQARVAAQLGQVGLHLGQMVGELRELVGRQIQEPVLLEERPLAGHVDRSEQSRSRGASRSRSWSAASRARSGVGASTTTRSGFSDSGKARAISFQVFWWGRSGESIAATSMLMPRFRTVYRPSSAVTHGRDRQREHGVAADAVDPSRDGSTDQLVHAPPARDPLSCREPCTIRVPSSRPCLPF